MERACADCLHGGKKEPAAFVVYEADGLAKPACREHVERHVVSGLRWESLARLLERIAAMEAARRLGPRGEPTEEEMLATLALAELAGKSEAFLGGTVRRCLDCKRPTHGGPTRCAACALAGMTR